MRPSPPGKRLPTSPACICPAIASRADLLAHLAFYSPPSLAKVPNSALARRWFVERVRPALRWNCERFGEPVPPWLTIAADAELKCLPTAEHIKHFGTAPLVVSEFPPWTPRQRR